MPAPARQPAFRLHYFSVSRFLARSALALLIWLILAEGVVGSLIVGAPVIIIAVLASFWLDMGDGYYIRVSRLPAFALFFISRSLIAGVDVAWRTLQPRLSLDPVTIDMELRELPPGTPRWLLAVTLSLLPGTLSVEIDGQRLSLHCLNGRGVEADVVDTEHRIARLFGLEREPAA